MMISENSLPFKFCLGLFEMPGQKKELFDLSNLSFHTKWDIKACKNDLSEG